MKSVGELAGRGSGSQRKRLGVGEGLDERARAQEAYRRS